MGIILQKQVFLQTLDAGQVGIIACWNKAVFSLTAYVTKCRGHAFLVPALHRHYQGGGNVAQKRAAYILGKIAKRKRSNFDLFYFSLRAKP